MLISSTPGRGKRRGISIAAAAFTLALGAQTGLSTIPGVTAVAGAATVMDGNVAAGEPG